MKEEFTLEVGHGRIGGMLAIRLDALCWSCKADQPGMKSCDICNGKGYTLTDDGEALLAFIQRHRS